jgi:hypothetical protein
MKLEMKLLPVVGFFFGGGEGTASDNFVFFFSPGLPDGYFQTKNTNLGKFWRALDWIMLIYFVAYWEYLTDIWDILLPFVTFCVHLVHTFIPVLVSCAKKKSGNPASLSSFAISERWLQKYFYHPALWLTLAKCRVGFYVHKHMAEAFQGSNMDESIL